MMCKLALTTVHNCGIITCMYNRDTAKSASAPKEKTKYLRNFVMSKLVPKED
jgi:hypothetical protein